MMANAEATRPPTTPGLVQDSLTLATFRHLAAIGSDACMLAVMLNLELAAGLHLGGTFKLAAVDMERAQRIPGWKGARYRKAIDALVDAGVLVWVAKAPGHGIVGIYRLADDAIDQSSAAA